jgi:MoxR-like ATPase
MGMNVPEAGEEIETVLDALGSTVIADRSLLETVLLGVLARGHVLIEDVPGTGKTLIARNVARALGLSFSRVQFTPDLLPADVTGLMYSMRTRANSSSPQARSLRTSCSPTKSTAHRRKRRPRS